MRSDPARIRAHRPRFARGPRRTGLASFCGRPTVAELPPYANIASAFQRRMVIEDVEKRGRRWLAKQDFDWLIYDPIDERLALADFEDGGVLTSTNARIPATGGASRRSTDASLPQP